MWRNVQASRWNCDPIEVRLLKKQLANLSCKHDIQRYPTLYETRPNSCDQGVQVKCEPVKVDETTQMVNNLTAPINLFNPCNSVSMCPTCLVAFSMFNGGATKVMKDEELGTDFAPNNSDKSAENVLEYISRSTSFTSPPYSDYAFHDYSSECVYDEMYRHRSPKRSNNEVSFLDDYFGYSLPEDDIPSRSQNNFCMDSFINSIRPPLK